MLNLKIVERTRKRVELAWQHDTRVKSYLVQWSTDGIEWYGIGLLEGDELPDSQGSTVSYIDTVPAKQAGFYRVSYGTMSNVWLPSDAVRYPGMPLVQDVPQRKRQTKKGTRKKPRRRE